MAIDKQGFSGFVVGATRAVLDAADVSAYPLSPVAVVQADKVTQWGVVKADGTGIVWEKEMADVAYDATVAGSNAAMTFTYNDGTTKVINLPKENFLQSASYDPDTHILTMTLVDGSTVTVDLTDLVDVYTVDDTATVNMDLTAGVITANVNVSATAGNTLTANADGLYVPTPAAALIESVDDTATVSLDVTDGELTATVAISADADNIISAHADGLYADGPHTYVIS